MNDKLSSLKDSELNQIDETTSLEEEQVTDEKVDVDDNYLVNDNINDNSNSNDSNNNQDEFKLKILKMFKLVFIALILILVIGFIISLFTKKNYTYADVEDIMEDAAVKYFEENKEKLPKNSDEVVEIDTTILANHKYMKDLKFYLKKEDCSGKVSVEKDESKSYSYTPILSCNNGEYTTRKLYEAITNSKNVVKEGFGLYYMNNEYVYRGSDVNNYIRFSDSDDLWRIIKVTSNNEIALISDKRTNNAYSWDERYNSVTEDNAGINLYKNSYISGILKKIYDNTLNSDEDVYYREERTMLTKKQKKNVVEFDACVGTRSKNDQTKKGAAECSVTYKTKMSLLSVYDFLNASVDSNCNQTLKEDCQNYNYLVTDYRYFLANGDKDNSSKVYQVSLGYIMETDAKTESYIRTVIHLSDKTMLEKGNGSKKNPYVIR